MGRLVVILALLSLARPLVAAPVLVVGVDGLSFDVLDPLVAQGRVPTFARLLEGGARAVLRSETPMRSPALWTTIATGQPRSVHGIYDFVTGSGYWPADRRATERRLVTSDMRRSRALWQYATDAHRTSIVVGWLNTWPAEPVLGAMLAPYVALGQSKQSTIKGRIYESGRRQSFPPELFADLQPLVVPTDEVADELVARVVDEPPASSRLFEAVPQLDRYLYTVRWSIASLETNVALVEALLERHRDPALVMTYVDGADTLGHRFWIMRESLPRIRARLRAQGFDPGLAPELKRRLGHAIEGYYTLVDDALARMLAAAGPQTTVVIVSDHGWGSSPGVRAPHDSVPFDGEHRMDGVFIAHGPKVRAGRYDPLTLYDVAPTALHMLELQVPEAMPGRVAKELLNQDAIRPPRPANIARDEPRRKPRRPEREETPFEERELERLRSLGYVQ